MGFRAQRADRHRRSIKAFEQFSRRFNIIDADGGIARVHCQQIAQRGRRTVVHQLSILLIIAVLAALDGLLQGAHYVRVIGVVFAAMDILQLPALIQRFTCQPGAFGEVQQILLEVAKARTADTADHALEAQVGNIVMQTDSFEQLRAAVRGDSRDAHLGHDLVQAFVDAVTVVQHHGTVIFVDGLAVDQFCQRFVGQVRINCRRTEAQQHREVVRVTCACGFHNDVGVAAQALINQTRLDSTDGHWRRNRQTVLRNVAVGQHQQNGTVTHHLFRFITQRLHRLFEGRFGRVERNIERVGAVVLLLHGGELFEIGVQQDRRFKGQTVGLAFGFAEDVHLTTDAGGQRHHVGFTQRIDWRVSYLRKLLAEVVVNDTRLAGEHGKRGIVTHGADRFLAIFTQYADNGVQLFRAVVKLFLVAGEGIIIQLAAAHVLIRQIFKRHQTANVFLHPLFVRMTAFQVVIGFRGVENATATGVDHHQFARPYAAFFDHFVRLVIPDPHFRGAGNQLVFSDDVARRAQAVTVEVTGRKAPVGHDDTGRTIPRLHVHGVEVEEGTQFRIHIRVVLPGWRNQQAHGANDVHPAGQQQLQHVIH